MKSGWEVETVQLEAEMAFVKKHQKVAPGEDWYFISAEWMEAWGRHAITADARRRPPSPGPITNWHLLDSDGHYQIPKENLVKGRDYHCITKAVWNLLQHKYRGGPAITSKTPSLATAKTHDAGVVTERSEALSRSHAAPQSPWMPSSPRGGKAAIGLLASTDKSQSASPQALAEEMEFVKRNDCPQGGEKWHLIHSRWLQKWTKYTRGAGPHPGPISNWDLLDERLDYQAPKIDIIAGKDYRGVSPAAWNLFQKKYGGGPRITSKELNIYSADEVNFAFDPCLANPLNLGDAELAVLDKTCTKCPRANQHSAECRSSSSRDTSSGTGSSSLPSEDEVKTASASASSSNFAWSAKPLGRLKRFASKFQMTVDV